MLKTFSKKPPILLHTDLTWNSSPKYSWNSWLYIGRGLWEESKMLPSHYHGRKWAAQSRLQVADLKTSLILAKIGRKPGRGGTGGRRDGIGLGPLSCPGDDGVWKHETQKPRVYTCAISMPISSWMERKEHDPRGTQLAKVLRCHTFLEQGSYYLPRQAVP